MSKQLVSIIDVPKHIGEEITIGAWVANKSGKGKIAFLQLRDGTAFFQGVAFKPNFIEKFGPVEIDDLYSKFGNGIKAIVDEDVKNLLDNAKIIKEDNDTYRAV